MNKLVSPKTIALAFGVLVISFAIGFYVFAWQEPTEAPPEGNVPTPLNVSEVAQTKEGDLTIGIAEIHGDGSMGPELNADKLDDYHAADLMAQTAGGASLITWGYVYASGISCVPYPVPPGEGAPLCPAGWIELYAGYGPFIGSVFSETIPAEVAGAVSLVVCSASWQIMYQGESGGRSLAGWSRTVKACSMTGIGQNYCHCNTCRVCVR